MARRQSGAKKAVGEQTIDLTPMLDMVFILLIFFIVTAQFIKVPGVPIERPDVDNQAAVKPLGILIAIDADNTIFIDKSPVPLVELGFILREMRLDNPRGEIVLQADVNSDAGMLVDVMEAINRVDGSTRINVSAKVE